MKQLNTNIADLTKQLKEAKRTIELKEDRTQHSDKHLIDQIDTCRLQIEQSQKETKKEAELKNTWIKKHKDICEILSVSLYFI